MAVVEGGRGEGSHGSSHTPHVHDIRRRLGRVLERELDGEELVCGRREQAAVQAKVPGATLQGLLDGDVGTATM